MLLFVSDLLVLAAVRPFLGHSVVLLERWSPPGDGGPVWLEVQIHLP